jgi:hypothetical protein
LYPVVDPKKFQHKVESKGNAKRVESDNEFEDEDPKIKVKSRGRSHAGSSDKPKSKSREFARGSDVDNKKNSLLSQSEDYDNLESLRLDELQIDKPTPILNRLVKYIQDHESRTKEGYVYTPNTKAIEQIFRMPFHDPGNRKYKLQEDTVALYEHEMSDGTKTQAWWLNAINECSLPNASPVQLFTKHTSVRDNENCPSGRENLD